MKTCTPQISWHDREPILSIDIQKKVLQHAPKEDGESGESDYYYRLATGGNDSRVNIWKASISDELVAVDQQKKNSSPVILDCLAELTKHQRSVNVVRFSPNTDDNLLASGDDDSLIFIWRYIPDNENVTKSSNENGKAQSRNDNVDNLLEEVISIETWRMYKILRGHNQDVIDLSWSKDGQYLVSGSVDNNVFVWDVHRGTKQHKMIKEHCGYVQGVTWDPLNKYIASLSTDRNMLIFNVKNGKTVHRVSKITFEKNDDKEDEKENKTSSKLFFDQTLMSFCRRLTFTPGGELLISPSGILESTNGEDYKNTVYVFQRNSLNRPFVYLPTNKFSVAVSCCPVVFELRNDCDNAFKLPYRIVFAVATQDSLLLYDTQQLFPFAYISQIHYLRLTDLSWSSDGRCLAVTSTDGFVTFVLFEKNELGVPYQGKLLEIDELEPQSVNNGAETKSSKKQVLAAKVSAEKEKEKMKTPKVSSKNITNFFLKSTNSPIQSPKVVMLQSEESVSSPPKQAQIHSNPDSTNTSSMAAPVTSQKQGRRVSLITLSGGREKNGDKYETGVKRKLIDNELLEKTET